jgi:transposase
MENKYPVVGVDIAKNFCFYSILSPLGKIYLKPFKELNDKGGLFSVITKLEKVEKVFGEKPVIVMESTGHYSLRLIHFFIRNDYKVFLINPLQSHSIKNSTIRKVKTDKVDCEELARLFFLKDLREYNLPDTYFSNLKVLSRMHFHLSEQRILIMNQLEAAVDQVLPGFTGVF